MIKSKVNFNSISSIYLDVSILSILVDQGGYQSKMKDRVQYPTEKKKKQQPTVEKKEKGDETVINGAKVNGELEMGQELQSLLKNGTSNGRCKKTLIIFTVQMQK